MGVAERRRREFERREEEILHAALELFDEDEWEAVTVEQIAARAEIGKGTVYKHFGTKHEIYARLALDFYFAMLGELEALETDGPPPAVLRRVIARAFHFHLARPQYRRLIQYCARDDFRRRLTPGLRDEFDRLDGEFMAFMETLLRSGIEGGLFPDRPVERLTFGLRATFDGALTLLWNGCTGSAVDVQTFVDDACEYMLAGLVYQDRAIVDGP